MILTTPKELGEGVCSLSDSVDQDQTDVCAVWSWYTLSAQGPQKVTHSSHKVIG